MTFDSSRDPGRVAMKGFDCCPYLTDPLFQAIGARSSRRRIGEQCSR